MSKSRFADLGASIKKDVRNLLGKLLADTYRNGLVRITHSYSYHNKQPGDIYPYNKEQTLPYLCNKNVLSGCKYQNSESYWILPHYACFFDRKRATFLLSKLNQPEESGSIQRQFKPEKLPDDCYWKGSTFHCGDKKVDFYNTKVDKYFLILTESLGLPIYNGVIYKDLGYDEPRQVATGVKKDLARKLDKKGLLKTKNRPDGRISITPVSEKDTVRDKRGGYICSISQNVVATSQH